MSTHPELIATVSVAGHETILQEAERLTNGDRNADYGHPLDDFRKTAEMWSAYLNSKHNAGIELDPEDVGFMMVLLKISRHMHMPKRDNLVDAAGYINTVAMCEVERINRNS